MRGGKNLRMYMNLGFGLALSLADEMVCDVHREMTLSFFTELLSTA